MPDDCCAHACAACSNSMRPDAPPYYCTHTQTCVQLLSCLLTTSHQQRLQRCAVAKAFFLTWQSSPPKKGSVIPMKAVNTTNRLRTNTLVNSLFLMFLRRHKSSAMSKTGMAYICTNTHLPCHSLHLPHVSIRSKSQPDFGSTWFCFVAYKACRTMLHSA